MQQHQRAIVTEEQARAQSMLFSLCIIQPEALQPDPVRRHNAPAAPRRSALSRQPEFQRIPHTAKACGWEGPEQTRLGARLRLRGSGGFVPLYSPHHVPRSLRTDPHRAGKSVVPAPWKNAESGHDRYEPDRRRRLVGGRPRVEMRVVHEVGRLSKASENKIGGTRSVQER